MNLPFEVLQQAALASVPAVGFGMVFHVPPRVLALCAAGGALGRGLRYLLHAGAGMPLPWSTLLAAATVSALGVLVAQRLRAHPKVFTVAAMIPMIPGVPLFKTLLTLVEIQMQGPDPARLAVAISSGLQAFFVVSALAVGLAVPGLLYYRKRPVV